MGRIKGVRTTKAAMHFEDIAGELGVSRDTAQRAFNSAVRKLRDGFLPGVPIPVVIDYIQAVVDEHRYPIACGSVECDRGYQELYGHEDLEG